MNAQYVNAGIVALTAIGLGIGVRIVASPLVQVEVPPRVEGAAAPALPAPTIKPDSLAASLMARDPFRVTRRPSRVAYDPVRLAQPASMPTPKPALALVGIVWDRGRDPTALIEGLPGTDGPRAVRRGETTAGLRVKSITSDRVVIVDFDTTWTLSVREPWR